MLYLQFFTKNLQTWREILISQGLNAFYRKCLAIGIIKYALGNLSPQIEFLNLSDLCFIEYRRSGEEEILILGRIFRRVAHKLYRKLPEIKCNLRFLNLIKDQCQ